MPERMTGYLGGYEAYRDILYADTIRDILYATSSPFLPNTYIDVDNELSKLESILQTMSKNNQLLEEVFSPEQSRELDSFLGIFESGDKL